MFHKRVESAHEEAAPLVALKVGERLLLSQAKRVLAESPLEVVIDELAKFAAVLEKFTEVAVCHGENQVVACPLCLPSGCPRRPGSGYASMATDLWHLLGRTY